MPECKRILVFGWPTLLFLLGAAGRRWWHDSSYRVLTMINLSRNDDDDDGVGLVP